MYKCNFLYNHKKTTAFPALIFTKPTSAQLWGRDGHTFLANVKQFTFTQITRFSVPSPLPFLSWLRCGDISKVPLQLSGNHHHADVTVTAHYKNVTIPLFFSRTESFLEYCRARPSIMNDRKATICRMTHPVFLHIAYKGEILHSRINEK